MAFKISVSPDSPFTLDNIPFGVISTESNPQPRCATALGDYAIDLAAYWKDRTYAQLKGYRSLYAIFNQPSLNEFAALDSAIRSDVRTYLATEFAAGNIPERCAIPLKSVKLHLPMTIGGYVDFACSLEHCKNCAALTGGTISKNFYYAPLVYNGRTSSIVPSPEPVRRPHGILYDPETKQPTFCPSKNMDYELEMGCFISKPVLMGERISVENAANHIFGFVLLNDWSARDLQGFEMNPLGPFHSKGFGTSISPWIVTLDALLPFSCKPWHDHTGTEFEHQRHPDQTKASFDIRLEVTLLRNGVSHKITTSNLSYLYWTPYQQVAHYALAGCGLETGDLLGTGTITGESKNELGCLFEATLNGAKPIELANGDRLGFLKDGDEIILGASCGGGEGQPRLGFGECRGIILPAV
ncbi:fumarylacetoacetate hydrolase, putative [Talaromyces stipitatus ATCC 10500]|uniref:Fumarylacetoacetase n=1 Tax=Talaromyces stipitatus (strain ATCC 10500 / CBS 375.48 / QM 6759 / NRRL 1006) TaxID=441959 RepID=B8LWM5_TALSN|nr:fumarylacetoacetate hydrolase, putative [Talaromyces stipitatus ATCC 10500]EED24422.1 fumarylacetoacetate hydrolase, putative [Talaromyces stipitatus ATCC 10500]